MKELSIKEKAKAYDEALKAAIVAHKDEDRHLKATLERIFTKLKESEDDRMKKLCISVVKQFAAVCRKEDKYLPEVEKCIAWLEKQGKNNMGISEATKQKLEDNLNKALEKETPESWNKFLNEQGEQKPADKVEPKFHEGDWVVTSYGKVNQVIVVDKDGDGFTLDDGTYFSGSWKDGYHLWTIQDAKDGDVLACNEEILLFKSYSVQNRISLYCWYNGQTNNFHSKEVVDASLTTRNKIYPATKEQRDLLFRKMKEAGYEWDADAKQLKKVEQKPVDKVEHKFKVGDIIRLRGTAAEYTIKKVTDTTYYTDGWSCGIERCKEDYELVEQKPTVIIPKFRVGDTIRHKEQGFTCEIIAVDTEYRLSGCNGSHLPFDSQDYYELVEQKPTDEEIKELLRTEYEKGRADAIAEMQKPWSEEDESRIDDLCHFLEVYGNQYYGHLTLQGRISWLKSFRFQNRWKPSDKQMEALESATENCAYSEYQDCLRELIGQLKKLREE